MALAMPVLPQLSITNVTRHAAIAWLYIMVRRREQKGRIRGRRMEREKGRVRGVVNRYRNKYTRTRTCTCMYLLPASVTFAQFEISLKRYVGREGEREERKKDGGKRERGREERETEGRKRREERETEGREREGRKREGGKRERGKGANICQCTQPQV